MREDQIYRIDHFLGKETVQSIMAVRFANSFFEPIWNRDHIDHVQITVAETVGVEHRGRFYEQTGALRDMVPNHLFQLLTMIAMEPPTGFDPDAVRNRKADILNAIPPVSPTALCAGSTGAARSLGQPVEDYRREPDVAPSSPIETYVALKLEIDTWRWAGVPFYLRTGKSMSKRWTEIAIRFRRAPLSVFQGTDVGRTRPELARPANSAGRGHILAVPGQAPGPERCPGAGQDELRLQGLVSAAAECRLRNADLRLHDRRRDAVPARRHGRGGLAHRPAGAGGLGARRSRQISRITGPAERGLRPRTSCSPMTAAASGARLAIIPERRRMPHASPSSPERRSASTTTDRHGP